MARPTAQPPALERLIDKLSRLPGLGRRSAQRVAFHLLKQSPAEALELAAAIRDFKANLKVCRVCGNVAESDPCPICDNAERDHTMVLVVEQPSDVASFESTGTYRGVYHVLMGRLAPLEGVGPGELNVQHLIDRVRSANVREVILGTNPTFEGDGTALYLAQQLEKLGVNVTRLARGLPCGASLEMVSKAVLSDAIEGRRKM
jgi:recombination protein RecR